jgi:tRNA A37 threonylcarbamoyladenosine synthetase subunit TsaC/SUA5/YrdC
LAIIKELGHPILSASVLDENGEALNNPEQIKDIYERQVDLILDGGIVVSGPSTVLDLTDERVVVLREGAGDVSMLMEAA